MTELEARLFAGRAVRAAQLQEQFARSLRPGADVLPQQREGESAPAVPSLTTIGAISP